MGNSILKRKLYAELKNVMKADKQKIKYIYIIIKNEYGGSLGVLFAGLSIILAALIVFINVADYSLYTYKRNTLAKAMDYAVTSAVQEINISRGIEGISDGFSETSGKTQLDKVEIDIDKADRVFREVLSANSSLANPDIHDGLLLCTTSVENNRLTYCILAYNKPMINGWVSEPLELEKRINDALKAYWTEENTAELFIDGNPATNQIEKGTYLFAVANNIEITYGKEDTKTYIW